MSLIKEIEETALSLPGYGKEFRSYSDVTFGEFYQQLGKFDLAKKYLKRLEELVGVPISIVSVGPKRKQTIILDEKELF